MKQTTATPMCGIDFVTSFDAVQPFASNTIKRRGPDAFSTVHHVISSIEKGNDPPHLHLHFSSSVLHLRGQTVVPQPCISERFILQWNGEIDTHDNDTLALLSALHSTTSVPTLFSSIRGEYAFVLFDISQGILYFGRDYFGRRSLVYKMDDTFLRITSVIPEDDVGYIEVPAKGIWQVNLFEKFIPEPALIPWNYDGPLVAPVPTISRIIDDGRGNMTFYVDQAITQFEGSLSRRLQNIPHIFDETKRSHLAILFSGGIDSVILAAITDRILPRECSIDLINVAFHNERYERLQSPQQDSNSYYSTVPDRITGLRAWKELQTMSSRTWNFVSVNVSKQEYDQQKSHVVKLIRPSDTVMDLSIAIAIWFAARGIGLVNDKPFTSTAKVLILGMGADEQLGGYSRHRGAFQNGGRDGLLDEMQMELNRIADRNLGRDDRCISDHGKEARFPFLDEDLVSFLCSLPLEVKCDMSLERGHGEKQLIRLMAKSLGFSDEVAYIPKRAIQFGAKTAKMNSTTETGNMKLSV